MKKVVIIIIAFLFFKSSVYAKEKVTFSSCVDGDTFNVIINGKENKVRLLAVDTPESVSPKVKVEYYGKEASEYTCKMISNAKKIELEYDEKSDKFDKYNRLLSWVFIDGKLLQELLVEKGYAEVAYLYGDYKYTNTLKEKQEKASSKSLGIWNEEEKNKYEESQTKDKETKYETYEIIIIGILLLITIFIGDKSIKNKAKKKLKKYLD